MLSFVREAQTHTGFDTGGDVDGDGPLSIDALTALACRTRLCHDSSHSLALAARTGDAEEPLLEPHLSGPFATGARLDGCRAFRAGPVAVAAHLPSRDFELGLFPVDGFLEGQVQIVLEVVAALRPVAASLTSEKILEDVVEGVAEDDVVVATGAPLDGAYLARP